MEAVSEDQECIKEDENMIKEDQNNIQKDQEAIQKDQQQIQSLNNQIKTLNGQIQATEVHIQSTQAAASQMHSTAAALMSNPYTAAAGAAMEAQACALDAQVQALQAQKQQLQTQKQQKQQQLQQWQQKLQKDQQQLQKDQQKLQKDQKELAEKAKEAIVNGDRKEYENLRSQYYVNQKALEQALGKTDGNRGTNNGGGSLCGGGSPAGNAGGQQPNKVNGINNAQQPNKPNKADEKKKAEKVRKGETALLPHTEASGVPRLNNVMNYETKSVSQVVLRGNILEQIKHAEFYKMFREILTSKYKAQETAFFKEKWIAFSLNGKKGYWNRELQVAVPVQRTYEVLEKSYFGIEHAKLSEETIVALFDSKSNCPNEIMQGIKASKTCQDGHWVGFDGGSFCVETERYANWNDSDSVQVGIVVIREEDFKNAILSEKYEILTDDTLKHAVSVLKKRSVSEVSEEDIDSLIDIFKFHVDREKIAKEAHDKVMKNFVMTPEIAEFYIQSLLECDTVRADLEKYDKKCLTDVNSGHWELWSDDERMARQKLADLERRQWELWPDGEPKAEEGQVLARLAQPLRARNPLSDIHDNGLIGIDFGTKSTIVSVQDGQEHTTLLRVGIGKLNKAPEAHHYENPTIMEFINLKKFLRDYAMRSGRPETSIDDIRVSHAADKDLKSCDNNSFFDSFFYDIKQWCGDNRRSVKLIDQKNKNSERDLAPFVSLKEGDFNPLELYAYYLGLYINNMIRGVYLDYVISCPVTYELDVKAKLLESFKAGLWKSLPEAVQNDAEASKKFRVRMGVSEPEAYAITALQGYGFDPEDKDEKFLYSIFDFGGGTTDFAFGIWRGADYNVREEKDKDYVIEHINSDGDKHLGGENLLELLAFEIFKANNDFMRTGKKKISDYDQSETVGFSYTLPPECVKPSGCETTIKNTPSARRNTKQLMEALRPFWEGIIGLEEKSSSNEPEEETPIYTPAETKSYHGYIFRNDEKMKFPIDDNGAITVDLFDNNGELQSGQKLYIQKQNVISVDLIGILEKRIERGVKNFFAFIMLSFDSKIVEKSGVDEIQIFLAGNSSKSPILKKLFDKYIQQENAKIEGGKSDKKHLHLFPPLGTVEAFKIQKARGIENNTDITAPTGKTGVAYGLIIGREGGPIRVITQIKADSQSKFRFNIGKARKGKFSMVLDRNEAVYGEWVYFGVASSEDFEIYYTSLPSAGRMPVSDSAIHKIRCRIPAVDPDADIYIRTIEEAPEDLEYAVLKGKEPDGNTEVFRVHLKE